jgi:hypothetical protein
MPVPSMTAIAIDGADWLLDGAPTYAGRAFRGWRIEGLLLSSPPIDWSIGTARKRAFFEFLAAVTGAAGLDPAPAGPAEGIAR